MYQEKNMFFERTFLGQILRNQSGGWEMMMLGGKASEWRAELRLRRD